MWDRQKQLDRYLNIKKRQESTPYPGEKETCQQKLDELNHKNRFTEKEIQTGRAMTENEFYGKTESGFIRTDPRYFQRILDEEGWDSEFWNSNLWRINVHDSIGNHQYCRDCADTDMTINRSLERGSNRDGSLSQVELGLKNGYLRAQKWLDENPISFDDIVENNKKQLESSQRLLKMSADEVFSKKRVGVEEYLSLDGDHPDPFDFSFKQDVEEEKVWSEIPVINEFYSKYPEYSPGNQIKKHGKRPDNWDSDEEDIVRDLGLVKAINKSLRRNLELPVSVYDLRRLKKLSARGYGITSLEGLEYAKDLEEINISYNPIKNLSPLDNIHNLKIVNVEGTEVKNLSELASHPMIQEINLANTAVKDLSELYVNRNLKKIDVTGCENFNPDADGPRCLKKCKGLGKTKGVDQIRRTFKRLSVF